MFKKTILTAMIIGVTTLSAFAMSYNEASQQDKPIVLLITMEGCGACKQFEPTYNNAQSKFSSKFNFVKEYIGSSQMAKTLNVQETPSVFIMQPKKKGSQRIAWDCLSNPGCFQQKLDSFSAK